MNRHPYWPVARAMQLATSAISAGALAVVSWSFTAALAQTPVAAASNCTDQNTCTWTQMNNSNWQPNSGQDPNCYNSCAQWTDDCSYTEPYWSDWYGQNNLWQKDIVWAVNTWNAVQECTPSYRANTSSSQYWAIHYTTQSLPLGICGLTTPSGYVSGSIYVLTSVTVALNSNATYYDGPVPRNAPNGSCNLKYTWLHETGHSYGEGHSSVNSDVMYPNDNNVTAIDSDAHHMLAAVYGEPTPSGCSTCRDNPSVGVPLVHQMGPTYFIDAMTNKALGAAGAAQAAGDDADDTANDEYDAARCLPYALTPDMKCISPPQPIRP